MSEKVTREDVEDGLAIFRAAAQTFEEGVSALLDRQPTPNELADALGAIKSMVSIAHEYHCPPHDSKKPPRGLGYSKDEAMIVASLPWFDNNMTAAIAAHYPRFTSEEIRNCAKRIREHQRAIEDANATPLPWENSGNWLGDI